MTSDSHSITIKVTWQRDWGCRHFRNFTLHIRTATYDLCKWYADEQQMTHLSRKAQSTGGPGSTSTCAAVTTSGHFWSSNGRLFCLDLRLLHQLSGVLEYGPHTISI